MRCLRRYLPHGLHHLHREQGRDGAAPAFAGAGAQSLARSLCLGCAQDRARDGQGRGCLSPLRALRRALSNGCVGYAEVPSRHDTGGAGMPKPLEAINDFVVKFANVNGSGSASANQLFAKSVLRMGVPVASRNIFPSNIQGLPTWFEVRVSEAGHLGRRGGVDLMVAMNPQTWDQDVKSIEPGGYLLYDSSKPLPPEGVRDDITLLGVPLTAICNATYDDPRQRQLFKNIIYVGALTALLGVEPDVTDQLIAE